MRQVRVALLATDPVSLAGLARFLDRRPEVELLRRADLPAAHVATVAVDRLTPAGRVMLREVAEESGNPVVLIANQITEGELLTAVNRGVAAIIPRASLNVEYLVRSIVATANGGGVMPPRLLGQLLKHLTHLQRQAATPHEAGSSQLTPREIEVLRLVAEGLDTAEIADRLRYSERTVKNVIYGMTQRLKLRNRSHAVAFAIRTGYL